MGLAEFKGHVEEEEKEAEGEEEPEHNLVDTVDGEHDPEIVHHNKRVVNVISGLFGHHHHHHNHHIISRLLGQITKLGMEAAASSSFVLTMENSRPSEHRSTSLPSRSSKAAAIARAFCFPLSFSMWTSNSSLAIYFPFN